MEQRIDLGLTSSTPATGSCGDSCGCGHGAAASTRPVSTDTSTDVLLVDGMTCAHCVRAVTDELNALDGVEVVDIDLRVGEPSVVRISSTGTADDTAIAAAIDEAGYTLSR